MEVYSHSRLSTYEQCPQKFKLKYIDKIEVEFEQTIEAFLGEAVHASLEWFYSHIKSRRKPSSIELIDFYINYWNESIPEKINIVKEGLEEKDYFKLGRRFLEKYYENNSPFEEEVLALEKKIVIDLDGSNKYLLQGYVDKIIYNPKTGNYEIHDYKTNNFLKSQSEIDNDRQLALYSLGLKELYPDAKNIILKWHFLAFGKEIVSSRTEEQLLKLKEETINLIRQIESEKEWPTNESKLCKWCEYKEFCPLFKQNHLEKVNSEINLDEINLVEKYAELYDKKKKILDELEEEIKKIKEIILDYAKAHDLQVIFGENHRLIIKTIKKFKSPSKNTEERQNLERVIKNLGLWDKLSTLDTFALNRSFKDAVFGEDTLKEIEKFGKIVEDTSIFLRKKEKKASSRSLNKLEK